MSRIRGPFNLRFHHKDYCKHRYILLFTHQGKADPRANLHWTARAEKAIQRGKNLKSRL